MMELNHMPAPGSVAGGTSQTSSYQLLYNTTRHTLDYLVAEEKEKERERVPGQLSLSLSFSLRV